MASIGIRLHRRGERSSRRVFHRILHLRISRRLARVRAPAELTAWVGIRVACATVGRTAAANTACFRRSSHLPTRREEGRERQESGEEGRREEGIERRQEKRGRNEQMGDGGIRRRQTPSNGCRDGRRCHVRKKRPHLS